MMMDLDNLKYINDTYGHDCGDGYIRITELQLAGKKRMHADELLRGFKEIAAYYCQ